MKVNSKAHETTVVSDTVGEVIRQNCKIMDAGIAIAVSSA